MPEKSPQPQKPKVVFQHSSFGFYAGIWGIISGIVFGVVTRQHFDLSWAWLIVAGLLLLVSLRFTRIFTLPLAFCAGFLIASFRINFDLVGQEQFAKLAGNEVTLSGTIVEDPDLKDNMVALRLSKLAIQQPRKTAPASASAFVSAPASIATSASSMLEPVPASAFTPASVSESEPVSVPVSESAPASVPVENLWKSSGKLSDIGGKIAENCAKDVEKVGDSCGENVQKTDISSGKVVQNFALASASVEKVSNIEEESEEWFELDGTMYVRLSTTAELERSDKIILQGKLSDGFGTFVASMYRPKLVEQQKPNPPDFFVQVKKWFSEAVHRFVPSPAADLGLGYLMGMKTGLPDDLVATLQIVGMTHVVVASGAHLGILTNVAKKFFGKFSKFAGTFAALLMIGFFVMLVGFTPSMTRAGLVAGLSLLVGYVGRQFSPLRLLSLVAALTLLFSPTNLLNLGWQLSFASFFGILLIAPWAQKMLYGGKKVPWLAGMLITSIATSLVCAPILIYNFGSISFLSLVANLVILPTLPYAMLFVFLTGITSFWTLPAQILGAIAKLVLELHINLVNFLSEKTMFVLALEANEPRIFLLYLPILAIMMISLGLRFRRNRKKQPVYAQVEE